MENKTEKKVIYLQNRDALVAMANDHEWNYVNPSDPSAGRRIKGLEFDGFKRQLDYLSVNFSIILSSDFWLNLL